MSRVALTSHEKLVTRSKQTVMHVQQEAISHKQIVFRLRKDIQSEKG